MLTLVALSVLGCGGGGSGAGIDQRSEPALPPSGPDARTITYTCAGSSNNTILVELPGADRLADLVNPMDLCEFDGDLIEISVEVPCAQGLRTITVAAEDNKISDQAVVDACALAS